ncbi:MAG: transcriptional coactivator p15/PC4 family protein [Brevundimonas sp.]|uniref:transcriptional coactivator p15/PC4 family protein n=1 Tax=Brevundimonas sp. TaxID=1871086 RepID=UPI00273357C6|nr:transcriptional coactivator p15/PC4 family protein [Brevundimonas sp.]MDP3377030.1 transcriptional coactivator p15/PC4 family protein [Brevundimonas sp.]
MTDTPIMVAEITKNSREVLKVSLSRYHGHALADVRTYAPVPGVEPLCPTKRGVSVRVEMLDELIEALGKAKAEAVAMGWIGGAE